VPKKGAIGPIFEGETPLQKNDPKYDAASGIIAGELLTKTEQGEPIQLTKKLSKIPHNTGYLVKTCIARNFFLSGVVAVKKPSTRICSSY
jgi:hypothetical protein